MADETLRSIYSAADETIAQLDQLHRLSSERALMSRAALDLATARLGDSSAPFVEAGSVGSPVGSGDLAPARQPMAEPEPYYALPQRTSHGGPFGPAVRAKLLAAALAKDTRW
jgi:hypothetical protein